MKITTTVMMPGNQEAKMHATNDPENFDNVRLRFEEKNGQYLGSYAINIRQLRASLDALETEYKS